MKWSCLQHSVAAQASMAGHTSRKPRALRNFFGDSQLLALKPLQPSCRWGVFLKTYINVSISFSVLNHYLNATVRTSLETSTAELSRAKFPKIVICNSFQLRWWKLVFSHPFFFKAIYSQDLWRILLQCIHWWFELCYQQAASDWGDWRGDWVKDYLAFKPFLEESAVLLSTTSSTYMSPYPSSPAAEEDED